jgi:hypothetical protein
LTGPQPGIYAPALDMSVLKRLKGLFESEEQRDAHSLLLRVRVFYTAAVHREHQLREQAELAPHAAGRDGLRKLAEEEKEVIERLRRILHELGSFAGDVVRAPEPIGALNYWARMAQSLDAHRDAVKELLDESALVTDGQPEIADELRQIARFEDAHCAKLRALIAKSDPQAID